MLQLLFKGHLAITNVSSFIHGESAHVSLYAIFQAEAGTGVEPPTFHKIASWIAFFS
jgi:hypothetical protein